MARWLRFANTLGALELLAWRPTIWPASSSCCRGCFTSSSTALARRPVSGAVRYRRRRLGERRWRAPRSGSFAPRRQRARILPGARRFVLTVARRSRFEALPPSAQTAATAVAPCASAAGRLAPSWALTRHPTVGATQLNDWVNSG